MEYNRLKLLEKNRYFEIVDSSSTLGVEYPKGTLELIIEAFIKHCETAISLGVNALVVEIDEELFRKQEMHNCFKYIDKHIPPNLK